MGEKRNAKRILVGKQEKNGQWEDPGIGERIILK
jgi:hypothetical protein